MTYVNRENARWLIPEWVVNYGACADVLEELFENSPQFRALDHFASLPFWCEINASTGFARFVEPDENVNLNGLLVIDGEGYQITLPLNPFYADYPSIFDRYCVYAHAILTDTPLAYIGITRRKWFTRLAEHMASAVAGSRFFFHEALRKHADKKITHRIFFAGVNEETAMSIEEEFVANLSLYPLGLNMIPGGAAGIKYLHSLGVKRRTTDGAEFDIARLMSRESVRGRPNPLCSARWASDPDYAERVVCGHSGRLTAEQIRMARNLAITGINSSEISEKIGAKLQQIENLIKGKTYRRIA